MFDSLYLAAGLSTLWTNIQNNWLGPIFLAAVAVFAIMFIKDRAWMKLIAFVGIAAIVGVLVYAGDSLFGKNGNLKNVAQKAAKDINSVQVYDGPVHSITNLDR